MSTGPESRLPATAVSATRRHSLRLRLIAGAVVCLSIALGGVGVTLSALFAEHTYQALAGQLRSEADSLTAALEWTPQGRLASTRLLADPRFDSPYSGRYWQVLAEGAEPLVSRSLWDALLEPGAPARSRAAGAGAPDGDRILELSGPDKAPLIVYRRTVTLADRTTPVSLLVTTPRADWEAATARFDRLLAGALGVTGLALLAASLAQVAYGLWPLRRLREVVARLRVDRRGKLAGNWPVEVAPVVDELELLLERDAAMLERARRQAGDLAHAIKTPLSVLANEAAERAGEPFAAQVAAHAETIRQRLERQLARARAAGRAAQGGTEQVDVGRVADGLVRAMRALHRDRAIDLRCACSGQFLGDAQDLAEMLGNLLDNACKWADRSVSVGARRDGDRLRVVVDDDGPGLPAGSGTPRPAGPVPLDERRHGSGLGLTIVEDIATLYGGTVAYGTSPAGGLRVSLDLPAGPLVPAGAHSVPPGRAVP